MPELPEVESVRRGLAAVVEGRTIAAVAVLHPRPVRRQAGGAEAFVDALTGQRFLTPRRRGKYLWLPTDGGDALLAHLGMSGQFRVDAPTAPRQRHTRVIFDLTGNDPEGPQLRFVDQRMFGGLTVSSGGAERPDEIAHIARDLLDPGLDRDAVVARIRGSSSGIKRLLLNQTITSGIGNIYADEALWLSRLHPDIRGDELSATRVRAVLDAAATVMTDALAQGGTSFDALYVNVNGSSGYFARSLNAYGRGGQPCPRCGTAIVREPWANRSSHRCPNCQRRPRGWAVRGGQ
ncbi:MAG: bifunctional DNA-formamidopyrimidine glycosylase/DNA-(apurinic or apyrimidinic site) lyase [Propioniciclava sp.]